LCYKSVVKGGSEESERLHRLRCIGSSRKKKEEVYEEEVERCAFIYAIEEIEDISFLFSDICVEDVCNIACVEKDRTERVEVEEGDLMERVEKCVMSRNGVSMREIMESCIASEADTVVVLDMLSEIGFIYCEDDKWYGV
jgi:hypothetical protein